MDSESLWIQRPSEDLHLKSLKIPKVVLVEYGSGKGGLANAVLRQCPGLRCVLVEREPRRQGRAGALTLLLARASHWEEDTGCYDGPCDDNDHDEETLFQMSAVLVKQGEEPPPVVDGFNEMEALAELNEDVKKTD
eukprot:s293_g15.t1